MDSQKDISVLRRLGERKREIGSLPIQEANRSEWARSNGLRPGRPMVLIFEMPWSELPVDSQLECEDPFCRAQELFLRQTIYQWENFPADMIVDPSVYCLLPVGKDRFFGLREQAERRHLEGEGGIASRHFTPVLRDEADLKKLRLPEPEVNWAQFERNFERMQTIYGDSIPVKKRGYVGTWMAPWDMLVMWWGVQEALEDMMMRPELIKAAIGRIVECETSRFEQLERLGALDVNATDVRVGSGGYGCCDELPKEGHRFASNSPLGLSDFWGFCTDQILADCSEAMHEEFALAFERPLLKKFGLVYYGCCEPLDRKTTMLRSITNLRKVSMSPWVKLDRAAQAIGSKYVFSFKPNPAMLAFDRFNAGQVRAYIADMLEKTRGCVVEIILKDISTIRHEPERLVDWYRAAKEAVDEFMNRQ